MHVASHALGCGHGSSNLDRLHDEKHRNPHQLNAGPDGYSNGERVTEDIRAYGFRRCPTLLLDRLRKLFQIYNISTVGNPVETSYLRLQDRYIKSMIPISRPIIYNTKCRRLFAATQLCTHGQWLHC